MRFYKVTALALLLGLVCPLSAEVFTTGDLVRKADLGFRLAVDGDSLSVRRLAADSPAAKAGLKDKDIVLGFNGRVQIRQRGNQAVELFKWVDIQLLLGDGHTASLKLKSHNEALFFSIDDVF